MKLQQIIFTVLCHKDNVIEKNTYTARHDILGALIMNEFNWTNYFGAQIHCVSDKASVVDSNYACRTLTFEIITHNNITKSRDRNNMVITNEVHI